ncbi:MAG: glycerol kinase GlpK [Myxococcota bacterium]|nr:glycerol kinase GlpK [Myxococcota bacterium]
MATYILAIDQGTTGTTSLVVKFSPGTEKPVEVVSRGYREFPQHFPKPGWVEHDLNEIWGSVEVSIAEALQKAELKGEDIQAIGITNQRETTGIWDQDGKPIHNAIVWQDRRTADFCGSLREKNLSELFSKKTGLVLDPYFSGTKVRWLLENVEGARARAESGELRFGTIDTWLVWNLTAGDVHITDVTNASRTLMLDITQGSWDEELCSALDGIPESLLPEVRSCSEVYGKTRGLSVLPDGIPIAGIAGDQQSSLFGQACLNPGMAKCTYGTGAFALVNIGNTFRQSKNGMLTTIAWKLGDEITYAIEGSVFIAGAIVQWLRDGLGIIESSSDVEALARSVEDNGGVTLVPALAGLGAPHWRPEARGVIYGLTRGSNKGHIARAALEGIAFQVRDLMAAMEADSGLKINELRVDGGATANELLMQFQADVLETKLLRPEVLDTTALGAAYLAALGVGILETPADVMSAWLSEKSFKGEMSSDEVEERNRAWQTALQKA